jgi:hypothetical protein
MGETGFKLYIEYCYPIIKILERSSEKSSFWVHDVETQGSNPSLIPFLP